VGKVVKLVMQLLEEDSIESRKEPDSESLVGGLCDCGFSESLYGVVELFVVVI
jgi:hypothetical protein